jgi:uncharacterized membrane protein YgaE (UPF0421/DUF939 family)
VAGVEGRLARAAGEARQTRAGRLAERAHRQWVLHPSWALAAKGAVAAAIAWFVGLLAPAPFDQYPYYAPMGAVVATTGTLSRSATASAQATGAILVGAVIARAVDAVLDPGALAIAIAVGIALLVSGWRRLGSMGSWAVTSALFVLILGDQNPETYVVAYAGLVVAGALVGVAVNFAFPPLPLTPSELVLGRARDVLADQLEGLADGLGADELPSQDEWAQRRRSVEPALAQAQEAVSRSKEAVRANRKARRYREWTTSQVRRGGLLHTLAAVVDDITRSVAEWETRERDDVALGPPLRPPAARAISALAAAVRSLDADGTDPQALAALAEATDEYHGAVRETRGRSNQDYFVAGAIVLALRRARSALATEVASVGDAR